MWRSAQTCRAVGVTWCQNGMGNNCEINYAVGYQIPGAFAEFMNIPKAHHRAGADYPDRGSS